MAQGRSGQRGVANVLTCGVLVLFGALGLASGCSSGDEPEGQLDSLAESQTTCSCPKSTPCVTYTCVKLSCVETVARDGAVCEDKTNGFKGRCLEGLCCPGCVVRGKLGTSTCARGEGADAAQCGASGEYCSNCKSNSCLTGVCSSKSCEPVKEGEACNGTPGACHDGSCCAGCIDGNGACVAGNAVDACGMSDGKLLKCESCGNGDVCDGVETCSDGTCKGGTPLKCDDGNSCTKDSCGPGGCVNEPLTGDDCSDGDPCTTGDKCGSDGKCQQGTPIKCDDGNNCTDDACEGGSCVSKPKPNTPVTTCDDGNSCTSGDKCNSGKCGGTSTSGIDCNDGNPCSVDIQPDCLVAACTHTTPAASSVLCIADKCHEGGHCSGTDTKCVAGPEIDCDDKNPCTTDSCAPSTGCVHVNDAAADCSDGDPCTENDVCVGGVCGGKVKKCLALDACHDAGTCDGTTGACTDLRAEDGKECPGGSCKNGTCVLDENPGAGGEGAGGEASGGAGPGAGGAGSDAGGVGSDAGGAGTGPNGGTVSTGEAGESNQQPGGGTATAEEPDYPFVRKPEGCSCDVPGGAQRGVSSLAALAFLAGIVIRRSRRGREAA